MSSISRPSTQRFRVGAVMLAICLSLPVADHFLKQTGSDLSAFSQMTLGGGGRHDMAQLGYGATRDLPAQP